MFYNFKKLNQFFIICLITITTSLITLSLGQDSQRNYRFRDYQPELPQSRSSFNGNKNNSGVSGNRETLTPANVGQLMPILFPNSPQLAERSSSSSSSASSWSWSSGSGCSCSQNTNCNGRPGNCYTNSHNKTSSKPGNNNTNNTNCVPIYYPNNPCCPIDYHCPPPNNGQYCVFGQQKYPISQTTVVNIGRNNRTDCRCLKPPQLTCIERPTGNCTINRCPQGCPRPPAVHKPCKPYDCYTSGGPKCSNCRCN
ncbi:GATA zinc finger domain-containing protein 12-like [Oppia nitens]|uniref:GATA zinc finger domain-containing protein 12-like n=1 Tax=Oppia nitens TaxID=1686743 RepID=UPI0023DA95CE|nr:GATA zinc finger domain-containing protein 12-like [Oppia nitens]